MEMFWDLPTLLSPLTVALLLFVLGCTYLRRAQIRHYARFPVPKARRRKNGER